MLTEIKYFQILFFIKPETLFYCEQDGDAWKFLQEASALDPRFKNRIDSDEIWQRVLNAALDLTATGEVHTVSVRLYFCVLTGILATTHKSLFLFPKTPDIQIFVFSNRYQAMLFPSNAILSIQRR